MKLREAVALLAPVAPQLQRPGAWVDLGAGDGTFTMALAELLPPVSTIEAVDRDERALRRIPTEHAGVAIQTTPRDFTARPFAWSGLAGALMANALHFVEGQELFLAELGPSLSPGGHLLIVEYDTDVPRSPWVPFPVSERSLARLASRVGFASPVHVGRRRSRFGGEMYAALLTWHADRTFAEP